MALATQRRPRMSGSEKDHGATPVKLKKELGLFGAFAYIFGGTVGSGIFISPTFIFHTVKSGGVALIVWIVAAFISLFGAVSFCELGGLVKNSGGEYTYILKGFSFNGRRPFNLIGPVLAFSAVWTYAVILRPASFSVVMLTAAEYTCQPFYGDGVEVPKYLLKAVAIGFMIVLAVLNCFSSKETTRLMGVLTVAKFAVLVLIFVLGLNRILSGTAMMLGPSLGVGVTADMGSIFTALYSALWAYEGWSGAAYLVEEVKDVRWLPLVAGSSMLVVGFCYSFVVIAYMSALDPGEIETFTGQAIALPFAKKTMGSFGVVFIPLMVALSTFGAANGTLFCASRVLLSASRQGFMPSFLSGIHRVRNTPIPAIAFQVTMAICLTSIGEISGLIKSFSAAIWVYYSLSFVSLLIMRVTHRDEERPFTVLGIVPALMAVVSISLVLIPIRDQLLQSVIAFAGILLSVPVYFLFIHRGPLCSAFTTLNEKLTDFVFVQLNCVASDSQSEND